jgi:hypothetical protein
MWREFEDGQRWRALAVQARVFRDDRSNSATLSPATTEAYESWWPEHTPAWAARYARDKDLASAEYREIEELWEASKKALEIERKRLQQDAEAAGRRARRAFWALMAAVSMVVLLVLVLIGGFFAAQLRQQQTLAAASAAEQQLGKVRALADRLAEANRDAANAVKAGDERLRQALDLLKVGRITEAEPLLRAVAQDKDARSQMQRDLSVSYNKVGDVQFIQNGLDIIAQLKARSPDNTTLPKDLAWFESQIAKLNR